MGGWDQYRTNRQTQQTRDAVRELVDEQKRTNELLQRLVDALDPRPEPVAATAKPSNGWTVEEKRGRRHRRR